MIGVFKTIRGSRDTLRLALAMSVALVASDPVGAVTLDHTGWFPFHQAWSDTSRNITDQSWSVEAPAGKHGFLQTTPDGHFRFQDSPNRVRFSGYVNVRDGNLPDSAYAVQIARRLRRLGVNFLRIHFMDEARGLSLFTTLDRSLDLDPGRLRTMDFFLKCLRDQGIYYNFCIQTARQFKKADGLPEDAGTEFSKIVSLFDPGMIRLQKDLAKQLANHVNSWTGLAYKDDPAVISWELTNENSLFQGWLTDWGNNSFWDTLGAPGRAGGMSPYYYRELDTLWNRWLAARYASDSVLAKAWGTSAAASASLIPDGSFDRGSTGWSSYSDPRSTAKITVSRTGGAGTDGAVLSVQVLANGVNPWDASFCYGGMTARADVTYKSRFRVKGSARTTVRTEFLKENVWLTLSGANCPVDTTWTVCENSVLLHGGLVDSLRMQIDVGNTVGDLMVDSVSVEELPGKGLQSGESMANFRVRRTDRSNLGTYSEARGVDEARFYSDLEANYIRSLTSLLKDSIGVKVPVTFTNNWYGLPSIRSQAQADYMDAHWYWDHPIFPAGWSESNFSQMDRPMVTDDVWGPAKMFSLSRVVGKPFMASEYNHPWPNQYMCEATAFYYGYMGFLDADGALIHAFFDGAVPSSQTWYRSFFNSGMNPVISTQQHLARLFRTGAITPSPTETVIDMTEYDAMAAGRRYLDNPALTGSAAATLVRPMRWGNLSAPTTTVGGFPDPGTRAVSSTRELDWDRTAGILRVDNASWKGLVGFLGSGATTSALGSAGLHTTGGRDFAAVHLVSADSLPIARSSRLLLLTAARMENPGTSWTSDWTMVTRSFVQGDTAICEPVTGPIWIRPGRKDSVSVYPLDPSGNRRAPLGVAWSGDTLRFVLPGGTLWYEIAKGDITSQVSIHARAERFGFRSALRAKARGWEVAWSTPAGASARMRLEVIDPSGRILSREEFEVTGEGARVLEHPAGKGVAFVRMGLRQDGVELASELVPIVR